MITVEGIFKDGKVQLLKDVADVRQAKVLVTFLVDDDVEAVSLGLNDQDAVELRHSFATFEDWEDPALDIYSDYDNARSALEDAKS